MGYIEEKLENHDDRLLALEKALAALQKPKGGGRPVRKSEHAADDAVKVQDSAVVTPTAPTWNPVAVFCEVWKSLYHNQYKIDGRDARALNEMAKGLTEPHWRGACKAFVFDPQPSKWTLDSGHSVTAMYHSRNRFLAEGAGRG